MRPAKVASVAAWVIPLAIATGLLLPARLAGAANAEAEGRKHARKANHLADTNKCKLAIPEYGKALRLLKDPTLLFNRAECYRRTGDSAKAVADYRKFLVELPTAPNRAQVEGQIATLDRRPTAAPAASPTQVAKPPAPRAATAAGPRSPASPTATPAQPARAAPPAPAASFSMADELRAEEQERAARAAPGVPTAPVPEPAAPMALVNTQARPADTEADHGSSHWWVWVLGAVVVAGGAAATYFALKQGKTDIPSSDLGNYKF